MNKEYHDNEALKEAKKRTKKMSLLSPHFPGLNYNNSHACYSFDIH